MYAAGCIVGKSEQRSKLFEGGNSATKGMKAELGDWDPKPGVA
jgi:hypothetical protein